MTLPTLNPLLRTLLAFATLAALATSHAASAQTRTFHFGEGQSTLPGQHADGNAARPRPQPAPGAHRAPAHRPTHVRSRHRARRTHHAAPPPAYSHH